MLIIAYKTFKKKWTSATAYPWSCRRHDSPKFCTTRTKNKEPFTRKPETTTCDRVSVSISLKIKQQALVNSTGYGRSRDTFVAVSLKDLHGHLMNAICWIIFVEKWSRIYDCKQASTRILHTTVRSNRCVCQTICFLRTVWLSVWYGSQKRTPIFISLHTASLNGF